MKNLIIEDKILLYHSSNNIIKNGYMTWFTNNDLYLYKKEHSPFKIFNYIIDKTRCYNNKCSYADGDNTIQTFISKNLKLIELNETSINMLEMGLSEQSIINYLVNNKIDGFVSKNRSFVDDCMVYYLFVNNNLDKSKILKYEKDKIESPSIKTFVNYMMYSIYDIIISIYYLIIII